MTRSLGQLGALLFDADPSQARCRRYRGPVRSWGCPADASAADVRRTVDELDAATRDGAEIVLSLAYEAYRVFSVADGLTPLADPGRTPLLQAVEFAGCDLLTADQALAWLAALAGDAEAQFAPVQPSITAEAYGAAVERVREQIAAGRTYQANLTFGTDSRLRGWAEPSGDTSGGDRLLASGFAQLAAEAEIGYGALLLSPETSLLSLSPELFFSLDGRRLTTRPMKGTAPIGATPEETAANAEALAADPKNRAENLMIVDLLRNDLARLPQTRQVAVSEPFAVAQHGSVLQMTTTITADLDVLPSLWELLDALFPCGSVTGAPKRETIRILGELEAGPRGAYCGAIGYLSAGPDGLAVTMSVPIRTLEAPAEPDITPAGLVSWPLRLGLGAGITYPSVAADEWAECLLKGQFLDRIGRRFELIETIRLVRTDLGWLAPAADAHRERMASSAAELGLPWRPSEFDEALMAGLAQASAVAAPDEDTLGLRLGLGEDGQYSLALRHLETVPVARFALHPQPRHSADPTLRHKTTLRSAYDRALADARSRGLFDAVFTNERGELTEGARSCLLVRLDGAWHTPPLCCGVLPSLTRAASLADLELGVIESVLTPSDLLRAEELRLGNALYGLLTAQFVD
ncbi:chorismate-binding protein [Propionicimonas paludicola]|uniref:chorismate-binding protein n=1 Tax=Propionicimonas paludicola TaxID=185243 RepID=UPI00117B595C|nr:chorismate-binding protein [Propionicimonas paludicola]